MTSPVQPQHDSRQFWALVPSYGTHYPIKNPVFFTSQEEVRLCYSTPIFAGRDERRDLETASDWLKAIESDVPVPSVLSWGEEVERAFSQPNPPKSKLPQPSETALCEQWLAARTPEEAASKLANYVLGRYGFRAYRLYMSIDKKRAGRILRKRGVEAFFQFMNWKRMCVNPPNAFVLMAVPVHKRCDDTGPSCELRLRDHISLEQLNPVPADFDTFFDACWANPVVPYMQCLQGDWNFAEIQQRASHLPWHQAPERKLKIENARNYFARVALELDDALRSCWPSLSASAIQAFWTSWEVSQHLTDVKRRIERYASEPGAVTGDRGELGEAQTTIESIIRHYVIECLEEATDAGSHVIEPAEQIEGQQEKVDRDRHQVGEPNEVVERLFASEAKRDRALAVYVKFWGCSEASMARAARVHPSDLCKWKKNRLPTASDKIARIENVLRNNTTPTPSHNIRTR
jgi:hypothetical protein